MIDTVIIRLHDLNKYSYYIKCLDFNNKNGYSTNTGKLDKDEAAELRRQNATEKEIIDFMQKKETGEFLIKTQVAKQMNTSSHYQFTYLINYTKDFIEFNFSIPKYKYGTNILMFIEHENDRDFKFYQSAELEYNIENCYNLFISFLHKFFHDEFILCKPVDWKDVEIFRIDVCFNQLFRSREDALRYLEYQRSITKKYARNEDGVMRDYNTALMYVTKMFSAKIYHKGTEYQKNDLKQHLRINEQKGKEYFKTDKFQAFSNKMLRYELTIRNGLINYLHKHNIFRKNCKFFKSDYRTYMIVENAQQKNIRLSKKIGSLPDDQKEQYLREHPYEKIPKDFKQIHKSVTKLITRRRYFKIEVDELSYDFNRKTIPFNSDDVKFCPNVLKLCLKKLVEFIKEYQIKELPAEEIVRQHIEYYNTLNSIKLRSSEMLRFYSHLLKHGSFKDAAKYLELSRATLYRYKQKFKKIGITDKSLKLKETTYTIPLPTMDLKEYHSTIIYDNQLLRGININ